MKNYNKMEWIVYKNGKEEAKGECDVERVKDELISDMIGAHFYKNCKISLFNYNDIKVEWTEKIVSTTYKTVRKYTENRE